MKALLGPASLFSCPQIPVESRLAGVEKHSIAPELCMEAVISMPLGGDTPPQEKVTQVLPYLGFQSLSCFLSGTMAH